MAVEPTQQQRDGPGVVQEHVPGAGDDPAAQLTASAASASSRASVIGHDVVVGAVPRSSSGRGGTLAHQLGRPQLPHSRAQAPGSGG